MLAVLCVGDGYTTVSAGDTTSSNLLASVRRGVRDPCDHVAGLRMFAMD